MLYKFCFRFYTRWIQWLQKVRTHVINIFFLSTWPHICLQTVKDNTLHSMAEPLAAARNSQPTSDTVHYRVPDRRDMHMQIPESSCSFNTFPVQPSHNFRNSDGVTLHNKGYTLRPPQPVPSNQFSFVHGERVKPEREALPPPLCSNRHHFVQDMKRENFYNNHERSKPPPYDYRERWNPPTPYSGKIVITDDGWWLAMVCFGRV